ncbi:hypothetical protein ACJX0J_032814 [Zea mays]
MYGLCVFVNKITCEYIINPTKISKVFFSTKLEIRVVKLENAKSRFPGEIHKPINITGQEQKMNERLLYLYPKKAEPPNIIDALYPGQQERYQNNTDQSAIVHHERYISLTSHFEGCKKKVWKDASPLSTT